MLKGLREHQGPLLQGILTLPYLKYGMYLSTHYLNLLLLYITKYCTVEPKRSFATCQLRKAVPLAFFLSFGFSSLLLILILILVPLLQASRFMHAARPFWNSSDTPHALCKKYHYSSESTSTCPARYGVLSRSYRLIRAGTFLRYPRYFVQ